MRFQRIPKYQAKVKLISNISVWDIWTVKKWLPKSVFLDFQFPTGLKALCNKLHHLKAAFSTFYIISRSESWQHQRINASAVGKSESQRCYLHLWCRFLKITNRETGVLCWIPGQHWVEETGSNPHWGTQQKVYVPAKDRTSKRQKLHSEKIYRIHPFGGTLPGQELCPHGELGPFCQRTWQYPGMLC